jgi:hypothetical protein
MGGLVLDIFVVYLLRVVVRTWRRRGTSEWTLQKANIENISCPLIAWGCPIAEVVYLYKIDDETYSGSESVPFIWRSSAEDYVRRHPQGSVLTVRVKPGDPETSIMRGEDQARVEAQIGDASRAAHGR